MTTLTEEIEAAAQLTTIIRDLLDDKYTGPHEIVHTPPTPSRTGRPLGGIALSRLLTLGDLFHAGEQHPRLHPTGDALHTALDQLQHSPWADAYVYTDQNRDTQHPQNPSTWGSVRTSGR